MTKESKPLFKETIITKDAYELKDYKKGDKLPAISDTMFLVMLNNEKRKKYVCYLLSEVLNLDYKEIYNNIKFIKEKLDLDKYYEASKTVDLICEVNGVTYNIEMNNTKSVPMLKRNLSYMFDIYKSPRKRGNRIYEFTTTIQINLNNFNFKNNKEVLEEYVITNTKNGKMLTDDIKIYNIYIPLIKKKLYNKEKLSKFEKLLLVFNEKDERLLKELYEGDKIMEEYVKDAYDASQEEEIIGLYDKELHEEMVKNTLVYEAEQKGIREGYNSGKEEGRQEGITQKQIEIAKNMLNNGLDIEMIVKCTGLTIEEIKNL